ncbi:MAG TPA: ATP-binding protein, partial [Anaeromyxobacteraceae bacterium]|nr:ATP-binding protein [Anaeromyxobacteraceae bacterium]
VPLDAPSLARDALATRAPAAGRLEGEPGGAKGPAVLAVPLLVRDQPLGVALVSAPGAERRFAQGELTRAVAIASQLAVAVDNARLYAEARRRAEELAVLQDVGRSLVATLELPEVLDAGVKNLARIVDAPDAYLLLVDEAKGDLTIGAVAGPRADLLGMRLPRDEEVSLAGLALARGEAVVIEDTSRDPRSKPALRALTGARALLVLPLLVRDAAIGAAVIAETARPRRFTGAEVQRAAAIANQLAVAVDHARAHAQALAALADLKQAQERLLRQERLAALGELSAVVAHEVRNPLGVIFNSLGSIRRLLRPQGDARMLLDIVGEEAERLNRIVGDLLDFARPSLPQLRPEPLDRVVDEAVAAALAGRPGAVEVVREVAPELPPVPVDARQVRQAVVNLAVNAAQAMPRGGRLTVRLRAEPGAAVLELEDTGAGIPDDVRARIFEPFFTTKATGTGLGLAVVKRIVDGHGGEVGVTSRPGAGTTFTLRFPLEPAAPAGAVESRPLIG